MTESRSCPTTLKITCRVLISLWDDGDATVATVAERAGLTTTQVGDALKYLCQKHKAERVELVHPNVGYLYRALEEPLPVTRPKRVATKSGPARQEAAARQEKVRRRSLQRRVADEGADASLPAYIRYRDRKIALLRRLAARIEGADRDLLIGILNDYRRGAGQAVACSEMAEGDKPVQNGLRYT